MDVGVHTIPTYYVLLGYLLVWIVEYYFSVLLPNVEHLYLRHIAMDALDRYQPDSEVSHQYKLLLPWLLALTQGSPVIINSTLSRGCNIGIHSLVIGCELQVQYLMHACTHPVMCVCIIRDLYKLVLVAICLVSMDMCWKTW